MLWREEKEKLRGGGGIRRGKDKHEDMGGGVFFERSYQIYRTG
jgi:hypothetical protein